MKKAIIASLLLSASSGAFATESNINWNLIDASYSTISLDEDALGLEPSGFAISGSYLVNDNVFILGGYSNLTDDITLSGEFGDTSFSFTMDVDITTMQLGAGYRLAFRENMEGYATLSYLNYEVGTNDANGSIIAAGVKYQVKPQIQVFGQIASWNTSSDGEDVESYSDTEFKVGASYTFKNNFSVTSSYAMLEDHSVFNLGGAYYF